MNAIFSRLAQWSSLQCGKAHTFILAVLLVGLWGASGPYFNYSDFWQLLANTGTTLATFLMVFLLQNSQTRESMAIQIKLDELIRATHDARNALIDVEHTSEKELEEVKRTLAQSKNL